MGQQGLWLAGWQKLAQASPKLWLLVPRPGLEAQEPLTPPPTPGDPGPGDPGSAGRTADGAGGAGSPGQVDKKAHSPSRPALLRLLGKHQAAGLKMSGAFLEASGGRGLKPKTNFTSSAISSLPQT